MKSYNSFETLIKEFPQISHFISNHSDYLAHTSHDSTKAHEKLIEHIEKVNEYALKLIKAHGLDSIVDALIDSMIDNQSAFSQKEALGNYIKSLFIRSIIFHDYGKINPNFQQKKMGNPLFLWDENVKIDSQHSKLSAFIFIHFHLKEIAEMQLDTEEETFLWALVFLFSNPILKHHASYLEHSVNFEENIFVSLKPFLSYFKADFEDAKMYFDGLANQKDGEGLLDFFEQLFPSDNYFAIITLLKLNFSLLTASDYYATNDYANGMEVSDFGLIDKPLKDSIINNFQEKKSYNKDLFSNYEKFKSLSFSDLQQRSNQNMNFLRQKLTVEVIENIRKNKQSNLFYLEAPTGAGKTNLSLAIATELMQLDDSLNKIFYVFPFNTLISQTFSAVKETLGISHNEMVQLHSKSGFHEKDNSDEKDAIYGKAKQNFIDNLFINYPITLFSHIKFFDILKGNSKETNYILHRLTNAIIIIDELQTYNPKHWDKVIYFLANYAQFFNLKVILMSATLPKIDALDSSIQGNIVKLVSNKNDYFLNENFKGRLTFDFSLLNWKKPNSEETKQAYLLDLKDFLFQEAEKKAETQNGTINIIIEFIKKKTASSFFRMIQSDDRFRDYELLLISGEILEPRRKEIIKAIKDKTYPKVLLISTQVVEAGVDIDMDIGFKDKSLIDSDEQLAGRVNRNASKNDCKVYIFNLDREADIYKKDLRFDITQKHISNALYQEILAKKDFDALYDLVKEKINADNSNDYKVDNLPDYKNYFKNFQFQKIHQQFRLIEEANGSVFVPLPIPYTHFETEDRQTLAFFDIETDEDDCINGADVWNKYSELMQISRSRTGDYIQNQTEIKKINGILSKFIFSVYEKQLKVLAEYLQPEWSEEVGISYLYHWEKIYSYQGGLDTNKIKEDIFL